MLMNTRDNGDMGFRIEKLACCGRTKNSNRLPCMLTHSTKCPSSHRRWQGVCESGFQLTKSCSKQGKAALSRADNEEVTAMFFTRFSCLALAGP